MALQSGLTTAQARDARAGERPQRHSDAAGPRERAQRHRTHLSAIFNEPPSAFLVGSALEPGASWTALRGTLMLPLRAAVIAQTLIAIAIWGLPLLLVKLPIYRLFGIGRDVLPSSLHIQPKREV